MDPFPYNVRDADLGLCKSGWIFSLVEVVAMRVPDELIMSYVNMSTLGTPRCLERRSRYFFATRGV